MRLQQRFPGSELVFDTLSPPMVRLNNLRMRGTQVSARYHWGLTRAKDVEAWVLAFACSTSGIPSIGPSLGSQHTAGCATCHPSRR